MKKRLAELIKKAKSENLTEHKAKKLAKEIRETVTEIYDLKKGTSSLSSEDFEKIKKCLDIAKKLEKRKRMRSKTRWEEKIIIVEKGSFTVPLIPKDFPFIKITGFVAGVFELFKDDKRVRTITGLMIVFDLDSSDERAKGISPTICGTLKNYLSKQQAASLRRSEKKLEKKIRLSGKELIRGKNFLLTFWNDTTRKYVNYLEFKVKTLELKKEGKNLLKPEINRQKNEIGKMINSVHYTSVCKIAPVRDGGKRFKR